MVESTASLRNVLQTLRNHADKSTPRHRSGSQTARSRTPRAQQFLLYAWNARMRFAAADGRRELLGCCLDDAWVLLECCFGAA
eukprot:2527075-Lingulodinium_polyedra.AAC.1